MTGVLGTIELGEEERDRLEASAMRIPLSLLKARHQRLFRAFPRAASTPGTPGDVLVIRIGRQETEVLLDREGRIVRVSYERDGLPRQSEERQDTRCLLGLPGCGGAHVSFRVRGMDGGGKGFDGSARFGPRERGRVGGALQNARPPGRPLAHAHPPVTST